MKKILFFAVLFIITIICRSQSAVVANSALVTDKTTKSVPVDDSVKTKIRETIQPDSLGKIHLEKQNTVIDSLKSELAKNKSKFQKDIKRLVELNDTTNGKINGVIAKINSINQQIDSLTLNITKISEKNKLDSIKEKKDNCLDYLISGEKLESGGYLFTIKDTAAHMQVQFQLLEVTKSLFSQKFDRSIVDLVKYTKKKNICDTSTLKTARDDWYQYFLEASANFNNEEPMAGNLKIVNNKDVEIFNTPTKHSDIDSLKSSKNKLRLDRLHIQFQDGNIENIAVYGTDTLHNEILKFENIYVIPFSSKRDYSKLTSYMLLEKNYNEKYVLKISDILKYHPTLRNYTRDFSPRNQIIDTAFTPVLNNIQLRKENTRKILQARLYTDLLGISPEKPNGLIQTEISKKILINSYRKGYSNGFNWGNFSFITPVLTISKIEDKLKRLELKNLDSVSNIKYASLMDMLAYQSYKVGANINLLLLDFPTYKSTFFVNSGIYYARTSIRDSAGTWKSKNEFVKNNIVQEYGINSLQWETEIIWQLQPEERYGLEITYRLGKYQLLANDLKLIGNYADTSSLILNGGISKKSNWYNNFEIFAFIKPFSNENKLFFRYRMFNSIIDANSNFNQTQIGYTFYLSKNNN